MKKVMATTITFFNGFVAKKAISTSRDLLQWFCCKKDDGNKLTPSFLLYFSSSLVFLLRRMIVH
jgi:hypothetical protein